jgi:glycosyltransferase involved in cell wall biosynthesis
MHQDKPKLVRITSLPVSMKVLLKGQMRFMKEQGFEVTMISSDGEEAKSLEDQEECPHIPVTLTRKISPFTDLRSLFILIRLFRKIKPQIVHTHTPKAGLLGMWAALLSGVPIRLHTIAGLPWVETKGAMRLLLKTVEKLTALPANMIYPNSKVQEVFLKKEGIASNKMKVLGSGSSNGINCNHFSIDEALRKQAAQLRKEMQVQEDACIWIFVGRLVKDKGLTEMLGAFLQLQQKFPQDRIWLLGLEEPTLDPLDLKEQEILHYHLAVKCWGFQQDIRPYLAAADILVFPSYREGFPNVPLQAGLMGCMLILSDINGCNEIVQDGENGILVPVKNQNALFEAMMFARQNPDWRKAMTEAIQQKIKTSYNQNRLWQLLLQEYQYWLQKKGIPFNS